jgi:hypothetical protein
MGCSVSEICRMLLSTTSRITACLFSMDLALSSWLMKLSI